MPSPSLTDFDPEDTGEVTVDKDPAEDLTLEDMGTDKELNTPPADIPDQEEPEADKPEKAEPEEKKEPEAELKKEADQAAPKTGADKTSEEILNYLGMDSTLKIKGKEYSLKDFSKEDLLATLQKGVRMTQIGTEFSQRERTLAERERVAEANVAEATRIIAQYRSAAGGAAKLATEPPDELKPGEYDTEDVKAVKQAALPVWKQNQELAQRLNAIEGGLKDQQTEAKSKEFMDDLNTHRADFPLASVEEVIAVHALRPDIPISDLVRRSHSIYGSVEHVEEVFKHCPEVRKHYEDKAVAAYLARNKGAKIISEKPSVQGGRTVSATTKPIRSMDDAGQAARKMLARLSAESEADND